MVYIKAITISIVRTPKGWEAKAKISLNTGARTTVYTSPCSTASKARYAILKAVNLAEDSIQLSKR